MHLHNRKPNIQNLYKVLRREKPQRPTLFELFMNDALYEKLAGRKTNLRDPFDKHRIVVEAFAAAGYDYATLHACDFRFETGTKEHKSSISLNEGFIITDEESYQSYRWPDPENYDYSRLAKMKEVLPDGMKLMVMGPGGVLENAFSLIGYDNFCYMLFENPSLLKEIIDQIGSRLLTYYKIALEYDSVGLIMSNDDWGFKTQTFLSLKDMRKYVLPWHQKIVEAAHFAGKPAVLHSCGYFFDIMDDVIQMGYDGKHSYEDTILPVEQSYDRWKSKIAILGGIDVEFLIRSTEDEITKRCRNMLEKAEECGGYALGTGNSVPDYLPEKKYLAMIRAALEW